VSSCSPRMLPRTTASHSPAHRSPLERESPPTGTSWCRSIGRPVVGVTSQSSLTALIQWLQASGSIGRGARRGNGDCAPFALCHPAARTAKPQTLTHCPQRPGRRGISRSPRGLPERLRQPRDVDGDPSRFVLRQPLRPPRFDFALSGVDVRERLPVGVVNPVRRPAAMPKNISEWIFDSSEETSMRPYAWHWRDALDRLNAGRCRCREAGRCGIRRPCQRRGARPNQDRATRPPADCP
jgi:hypothetical protein